MVVLGLRKSMAWVGKELRVLELVRVVKWVVMGLLIVVRLELNRVVKWVVMGLLIVVRLELNSGPSVLLLETSVLLVNRDFSVLLLESSVLLLKPSLVLMNSSLTFFAGQINSSQISASSGWVSFTLERKFCQVSADRRVLLLVLCSVAWHNIILVSSTRIPGS